MARKRESSSWRDPPQPEPRFRKCSDTLRVSGATGAGYACASIYDERNANVRGASYQRHRHVGAVLRDVFSLPPLLAIVRGREKETGFRGYLR